MGNQDYIEGWFHSIVFLQHHSTFQQLLAPSLRGKLVSHTHVFINIHFSNMGMCILEALFRKWINWNYSYL